jgi:glycosyltransferase involved in cell wall biosynthesis
MISVITPVYNGERFIDLCIKNVIEQNCPHVEHIIVDGGSTDKTVHVIKQYAEKYSHIRWISEKDNGQSDAMNKGISMAIGEILSFLNVDDFYQPNALNRVYEIFKRLPKPSLLVGNCNILGEADVLKFINSPKKLRITDLLSFISPFPYNPSAYFYHKSLHQKIGLYKVDEHYMMDIDFIIKAVQAAKVKYVNEIWGNHRQIQGTKTMTIVESGQHSGHYMSLLEEHRKKLSLFQQWEIFIKRQLNENKTWLRVKYFLINPQELVPSLKTKVVKALSLALNSHD